MIAKEEVAQNIASHPTFIHDKKGERKIFISKIQYLKQKPVSHSLLFVY